jgi:hypothetical protein
MSTLLFETLILQYVCVSHAKSETCYYHHEDLLCLTDHSIPVIPDMSVVHLPAACSYDSLECIRHKQMHYAVILPIIRGMASKANT